MVALDMDYVKGLDKCLIEQIDHVYKHAVSCKRYK